MSRDSAWFKLLPLLSVIVGIVAAVSDPASLGIPPVAMNWIKLISTIVAAASGWLGTSPLPGDNDASKVKTPFAPMILLAAAIGAGALGLSACASNQIPLQMPTSTAAVVADDAALRAYAQKSIGVLNASLDLAREVNNAEKMVEGVMPPSARVTARSIMTAFVQQVIDVSTWLETAAKSMDKLTSFAQLKGKLDGVLAKATELITFVKTLPSSAQSRAGFGQLVSSLFGIITNLVAGAHQ